MKFITVLTLGIGINILAIASAQAMTISSVSISAQFNDGGTIYYYSNDVSVGTLLQPLPFCNTGKPGDCRQVAFSVQYIQTTSEGNGEFSDEVKISYPTLFGTGFLGKEALFTFDGKDNKGNFLPIDAVIDYTKAGFLTPGYILNTSVFPSKIVGFSSNGAPNSAYFTLNYSYKVPEPTSALSLLAFGILGAASTLKRKLKTSQSTEKETAKVS